MLVTPVSYTQCPLEQVPNTISSLTTSLSPSFNVIFPKTPLGNPAPVIYVNSYSTEVISDGMPEILSVTSRLLFLGIRSTFTSGETVGKATVGVGVNCVSEGGVE